MLSDRFGIKCQYYKKKMDNIDRSQCLVHNIIYNMRQHNELSNYLNVKQKQTDNDIMYPKN